MAILSDDIKLVKSQVMLDTDDGGGRTTGNEVVDGQSNNIFPDISELDRTYGRISLRKLFAQIDTVNTDSYFGSHVIIDSPPQDSKVTTTLFTTQDWFDRRTSAANRVESYLAKGGRWSGHVYETQLEGQRVIQIVTRVEDAEPTTGQALCIVQNENTEAEFEQFVRVTGVSSVVQRFSVSLDKDVTRKVVTIEISDPLRQTFTGQSVRDYEQGTASAGVAVLRDTRVADAARYFSIKPLAAAVGIGAAQIQVPSIFTNIVPSSQQEIPLIDLDAAGQSAAFVAARGSAITIALTVPVATNNSVYLGSPILPQSLSFTLFGQSVVDNGGELKRGTVVVGTVDYSNGVLAWNDQAGSGSTSISFSFKPAASPTRPNSSYSRAVTADNRGYNWISSLLPIPAPATLQVSYTSQGRVYVLRDAGNGQLRGADTAFGSGTVNYVTGTVVLTTGALPDAGTVIMYSWGTPVATYDRSSQSVAPAEVFIDLINKSIAANTVTITWTVNGVAKAATDNGSAGITGDATGRIDYARGHVYLRPNLLPQQGTVFASSYQYGDPQNTTVTNVTPGVGGQVAFTISGSGALVPTTVRCVFELGVPAYPDITFDMFELHDIDVDGTTGQMVDDLGTVQGIINYLTREIICTPTKPKRLSVPVYDQTTADTWGGDFDANYAVVTEVGISTQSMQVVGVTSIDVFYRDTSGVNSNTRTTTMGAITFDITQGFQEQIIVGSVRFVLGGLTYVDRNGTLYHSISPTTGSGTAAGQVFYATGRLELTDWATGQNNVFTLQALATQTNQPNINFVSFRTPITPIRSQSITINCTTDQGVGLSLTADSNGVISTTSAQGKVDYQNGIVSISFGTKTKITSGNRPSIEAEPWYDMALEYMDGADTYIRVPVWVIPDTLRYSAVGYSYLPLSADILGLDPVRLPSDGQVPIYRVGDVVVVHDTQSEEFVGAAANQTLDVGRVRLASLRIVDAEGVELEQSMYSVNLTAGTVTLNSGYDIGSLTAPLYAEHRVEDMAVVTDLQINGLLNLNRPLTHVYTTDSFVSSALIMGDLQARAFNRFSQESWTNEWSDQRIGSNTTANFNDALYPITTTNRGAIQERWVVIFTNTTTFRVVGENVGQIATGTTSEACSPINPATGAPYFTIPYEGWGSGWAAGNAMRFNTAAANYPIWVARTVAAGQPEADDDRFSIQIRGDIDRV